MILKRRTTLEIGRALLLVDIGIVTIAAFLYGPRVGLYCVLGLFAKTLVVDKAIESIHLRKVCTIICAEPRKVEFIVKHLNRTATISRGYGAFLGQVRHGDYERAEPSRGSATAPLYPRYRSECVYHDR